MCHLTYPLVRRVWLKAHLFEQNNHHSRGLVESRKLREVPKDFRQCQTSEQNPQQAAEEQMRRKTKQKHSVPLL